MPVHDRQMPAAMYWGAIVIGFGALVFGLALTIGLVRDGWDSQVALLTFALYAAALDFLYAAFGPAGRWPLLLRFWE